MTAPDLRDQSLTGAEMTAINDYGLKPLKWWKLFEVDGWQCLVSIEGDEDDDTRFSVCLSTAFEALGEVTTVRLSGKGREWAETVFDGINDGPRAIQMILDQAGPMLSRMLDQ